MEQLHNLESKELADTCAPPHLPVPLAVTRIASSWNHRASLTPWSPMSTYLEFWERLGSNEDPVQLNEKKRPWILIYLRRYFQKICTKMDTELNSLLSHIIGCSHQHNCHEERRCLRSTPQQHKIPSKANHRIYANKIDLWITYHFNIPRHLEWILWCRHGITMAKMMKSSERSVMC